MSYQSLQSRLGVISQLRPQGLSIAPQPPIFTDYLDASVLLSYFLSLAESLSLRPLMSPCGPVGMIMSFDNKYLADLHSVLSLFSTFPLTMAHGFPHGSSLGTIVQPLRRPDGAPLQLISQGVSALQYGIYSRGLRFARKNM